MKKTLLAFACLFFFGFMNSKTEAQPAKVSKTNPLPVYMHYMPWFETPETSGSWGWHWTMNNRNPNNIIDPATGRRDIASNYYPLIGPYGSSDPDVIEYHLLLMKLSGVDGVLIDWYGAQGTNGDINSLLKNSNALINRTDETGMKFGLVLEDRYMSSVENAKANMAYAKSNYFNKPEYIRYGSDQDPLVGVFGPLTFQQPWQWSDILSSAGEPVEFLTLWYEAGDAGGNADGEYMWIYQDGTSYYDHLRNYYLNRAYQMKTVMGVAFPGFNAFYAQGGAGSNSFYIAHNNGGTLDQTFSLANQYRGSMDMLQLATFNDFGEGTMFEPTRETGYSYLVKLQQFTGVPYTENDLKQVYRLYNLRKQYKNDAAKQAKLNEAFNYLVALRINDAVTAMNCVEGGSCNNTVAQAPYSGTPISIPGVIEAENFDKGGDGVSYHDNDVTNSGGQYRSESVDIETCSEGGYNIGWTGSGEWLEYTVNIAASGTYNIDARVASTFAGGTFHIEFGGVDKTGLFTVPNTGAWQNWMTVSKTGISLNAGTQIMRIYLDNANYNLNKITITANSTVAITGVSVSPVSTTLITGSTQQLTASIAPSNASNKNVTWTSGNPSVATVSTTGLVTAKAQGTAIITVTTQDGAKTANATITVNPSTQNQNPYGGSPRSIPGTIEAEDYDTGGEGVAYHDNDGANSGGNYRTEGVDIESCSEGGYNIGWTGSGEWLEYTVNVATAGTYKVDVRVASIYSGGTFHIEFGGTDKTGLFTVPNTGSWQTWTTVSKTGVSLNAGTQVMRVYLDNANYNINKITFTGGSSVVAVTGVSVSPVSVSLEKGNTQQLIATISPSNASNKNISWSSNNTTVATVSSSGLVTAVAAGTANIIVTTQDGAKTASSTITITSGTITVTTYRIKNRWQNTYLYDAGDRVRYSATASGSNYQWILEDVGGVKEVKNLATGEYMHIENQYGYVECTPRTSGWASSRWTLEDVSAGIVRFKNVWQPTQYIHIENLQNQAQYGTIDASWWSAQWILEPVNAAKLSVNFAEEEISVTTLSPNPVTDGFINIYTTELDGEVGIIITDIQGTTVYESNDQIKSRSLILRVPQLNPGIYIIRLQQGDKLIYKKISIQ